MTLKSMLRSTFTWEEKVFLLIYFATSGIKSLFLGEYVNVCPFFLLMPRHGYIFQSWRSKEIKAPLLGFFVGFGYVMLSNSTLLVYHFFDFFFTKPWYQEPGLDCLVWSSNISCMHFYFIKHFCGLPTPLPKM